MVLCRKRSRHSWNDLDFENRFISVNHNLVDKPCGAEYEYGRHIQTPKTEAGTRLIPMLDEVHKAFIFMSGAGKAYTQTSVNNAIARAVKACNIWEENRAKEEGGNPVVVPHFSAHILRHTFCTRLCENENNIKVIQDIMGHSDVSTTLGVYADVTKEKNDGYCSQAMSFS